MIEVKGLDEAQKKLDKLANLGDRVSFADMLPSEFIRAHSPYPDMERLIEAGGFEVNCEEDLKAIPDADWDRHIAEKTDFDSWKAMQESAFKNLLSRTLAQ